MLKGSPVPFATKNRSANVGGSLSPIFDGQRDGTKVGWYGRRRGGRIVAVLTLGFVTRILCVSTGSTMTKMVVLGCVTEIPKVACTTRIVMDGITNESIDCINVVLDFM